MIAIVVYIPPSANAEAACDVVHAVIARLQANHTDSFIFLSGDFNRVSLSNTLPTFKQYIVCTKRGNQTLDLLYANVKNAYKSTAQLPLVDQTITWFISLPPTPQLSKDYLLPPEPQNAGLMKQSNLCSAVWNYQTGMFSVSHMGMILKD